MKNKRRKNKKIVRMRRKNSRVAKIGGIFLLIILILFVLMLTPLFNIAWLDISGVNNAGEVVTPQNVTSGEIKEAIGYRQGENIFKLHLRKAEAALERIPYVEKAEVHRKLPDGIRVKIKERTPVAYAAYTTGFALIDGEGRLLRQVAETPADLPVIEGADITGLTLGQTLADGNAVTAQAFTVLLDRLTAYNLIARVYAFDITDANRMGCTIDGNKTVIVGDGYQLDYKMMMLQVAVEELAPSEAGTITLTVEGKAIFTPQEAS